MPARTAASHSWRKFRGRRGPTHRVASIERLESRLLLSAGSIVQLTDTSTDNRWPSLNDQGDYVYSAHDGAGYWQIFKNGVQITTDSYNKKYPVIANNGDVVYFKQGPTGGAFGTGWQVIRRSAAGTESQIESSSQNTVTGARRDAGRFPGIASNATSISYLDFYNPSPPPTRRFNVSGLGALPQPCPSPCTAANFFPNDFPDIDKNGNIVYSRSGTIYEATVSSPLPEKTIGSGTLGRINDAGDVVAVSGNLDASGDVRLLSGPSYTQNDLIHRGSWADINNRNEIIVEDFDAQGVRQLYLFSPDTDGDGLPDKWETDGIDSDGNGTIDLYLNTNPMHKDVFVEIDAMLGRAPTQVTLNKAKDAFATARNDLVDNPDGHDGITLHAIIDESNLPLRAYRAYPDVWLDFFQDKASHFGTIGEQTSANAAAILAAKRLVYRYCIFADSYDGTRSGIADGIPGNDFIITLGGWTHGPDGHPGTADDVAPGGTSDEQAGTFMHELGHTLGLGHGGGDDDLYKPNYLSVMNYLWQTPNPNYGPWFLDYSRAQLPSIDEHAVNESDGFGGPIGLNLPVGTTDGIEAVPHVHIVAAAGPVHLNDDLDTNDILAADLNYIYGDDQALGLTVLTGHEDWSQLVYNFRLSSVLEDGQFSGTELNEFTAEAKQKLASISPGADNVPPRVLRMVFLFETTQAIEVAFDKNVVTSLNATDLMVQSIGSGATISPSSVDFTAVGNVATFSFGTILADGNYRATLPVGAVADAVGNVNTSPYTITFFVLTGDLNRDREVTISDFIDLASHFNQFPATWSEGDLNYDNAVTISDFIDLASNFNQSLAGTGIAIDSPQPALSTTESVLDESLLLTSADPLATIQAKRHPPKPHRHHRSHAPRPQLPLPARY